jgi:hydrolase family protein
VQITITRQDMVFYGGVNPWERTAKFDQSMDRGSMQALASRFSAAAGDAADAGHSAHSGSTRTAAGGHQNGVPMHDIAAHVSATKNKLGHNGADFEQVASIVTKIRNMAESCLGAAKSRLKGLDEDRLKFEAAANEELSQLLLKECKGEGTPEQVDPIATKWKKKAGHQAKVVDGDIAGFEDDYGSYLTLQKGELHDLGYDLGGSQVDFGDAQKLDAADAKRAAQRIKAMLARGNVDPRALARELMLLDAIEDDLIGPDGKPLAHPKLGAGQLDYLAAFYKELGEDGFKDLGKLGGHGGASYTQDTLDAFKGMQRTILGGAGALSNADRGKVPDYLNAVDFKSPSVYDDLPESWKHNKAVWGDVDDGVGTHHKKHNDIHTLDLGGVGKTHKWDDWALTGGTGGKKTHNFGPLGTSYSYDGSLGPTFEHGWNASWNSDGASLGAGVKGTLVEGSASGGLTMGPDWANAAVNGDASGYVGFEGKAGLQANRDAVGFTGDAFAGAKVQAHTGVDVDGVGAGVQGEAWAGVGADADLGFTHKDGKYTFGGHAGAAFGLGGKVGGSFTLDTHKAGKALSSASHAIGGLFD